MLIVPKIGDYFDGEEQRTKIITGRRKHMVFNFFKDKLFEVLDESSSLEIADIEADDLSNIFTVKTTDGSMFEIECRKVGEVF